MGNISTVFALGLAMASPAAMAATTSVSTHSGGSIAYDATTATLTLTNGSASAALRNSATPTGAPAYVAGFATLKIGFAAPLVRTDEVRQVEWTGSGHRYIASFLRGVATNFEYSVDSLPDSQGQTTNLLKVQSLSGFSVPFVSLSQLSYYYDFNGGVTGVGVDLYNPYHYYYDLSFIGLFAPCNCYDSSAPLGPRITTFAATSGIAGYVQNIFRQSNAFTLRVDDRGYDLWDVTTSSVSEADSFTELSGAGWGPAVPEPASWAMMIAGFGMVGTALRRQRRQVAA